MANDPSESPAILEGAILDSAILDGPARLARSAALLFRLLCCAAFGHPEQLGASSTSSSSFPSTSFSSLPARFF
jgi:hypothetical protein